MSADFINGIGARGPQIRESYGAGPRPALGAGEKTGEASGGSQAASGVAEGFSPTSEAGESSQDRAAGEATASQFSSAWGPASQGAVGGTLKVEGAGNTAIPHQVHGAYERATCDLFSQWQFYLNAILASQWQHHIRCQCGIVEHQIKLSNGFCCSLGRFKLQ